MIHRREKGWGKVRSRHRSSGYFTTVLLNPTFLPISKHRTFQIQSPINFVPTHLVGTDSWFGILEYLFDTFDRSTTILTLERSSQQFWTNFRGSRDCS